MTDAPPRLTLNATAADLAPLLPTLGRVMVVLTAGGATHERIGPLGEARLEGARLRLAGAAHDAWVELAAVRSLVLDRSSRMKDQVYPRLEFCDAGGGAQLSVIGMDGPAPFDAALAPFAGAPLFAPARPDRPAEAPEAGDPGAAALLALHDAGAHAELRLATAAASQSWSGMVPAPRMAMGFANLMLTDFHLHLRLGSVARFERGPAGWAACDEAGVPTGLLLRPADATGEVALAAMA